MPTKGSWKEPLKILKRLYPMIEVTEMEESICVKHYLHLESKSINLSLTSVAFYYFGLI